MAPGKGHTETKKKWIEKFTWKRASEYFGEGNYQIFDGIDPTDVIMGSCNSCYMFAALAGLAEASKDELHLDVNEQG